MSAPAIDIEHADSDVAALYSHTNSLLGQLASSLQQLYESIPVALGVIGRDGRYLAVNSAYAAIHGRAAQDMVGKAVNDYMPHADEQLREDLARFDAGITAIEREVACHGAYYLAVLKPVLDADGVVAGLTSVLADITARKHMELALEKTSRHWQFHASRDHLTGLPNRRHIDTTIVAEARRSARTQSPLSVLMIDVDYFKNYNDHFGHQRGDECLRAIAAQLQVRMRRHGDLVGRYGGEEFIAILPGTDSAGALGVAQDMLEGVRQLGITHPSSPYGCVTLSIGVASLQVLGGPILGQCDQLLGYADRALYSAKAAGRSAVCTCPRIA
jgi:diguanylate cyclase (GGDEF)-like protein/PAS domain S-box-containing protein